MSIGSPFNDEGIMSSFCLVERLPKFAQPFRRLLKRLSVSDSGVAAIEFAFIAPIMFFMFVGTVELSQAITVDRRVMVVASTTADLVAREDKLKKTQIDVYMQVINVLLAPYDPASLKVTILSVGAKTPTALDPTPTAPNQICWKYDHQTTTTYAPGNNYVPPNGIIDPGGSAIIAEVSYTYTPLIFSFFIKSAFPLNEKFYLKPRTANFIQYADDNLNYINRDSNGSCKWS
jgi:Flp pilus assembly protein TadG